MHIIYVYFYITVAMVKALDKKLETFLNYRTGKTLKSVHCRKI